MGPEARHQVRRGAGASSGPRRADIRRAALLDAAAELFIKQGVEATTTDEIAAGAGVAKGTLYHYFNRPKPSWTASERASRLALQTTGPAVSTPGLPPP